MCFGKYYVHTREINCQLTPNMKKATFSHDTKESQKSVLHEKGHCRDDSAGVIGVMEISLIGIFHCCVNDDPPTGEELHRGQVETCVSGVG